MDIANSFLVLFFLINITGAVKYNVSFVVKIDGFQKECEAPGCRYTGKIVGSLMSYGLDYPIPQLCFFVWLYKDEGTFWRPICWITTYPCDKCAYPFTACNCSGYNPTTIQFYPFEGSRFRISVLGTMERPKFAEYPALLPDSADLITASNEFDASIKPDDWDPIYVHDHENRQIPIQFSTNGNSHLNPGTNIVGTAILFAILLTEIMLNE